METNVYTIIKDTTKFLKKIKIPTNDIDYSKNSTVFYLSVVKIILMLIDYYFMGPEIPDDNCSICYDSLKHENKRVVNTLCLHFYHEECLNKWLSEKRNCPICRHEL